ncbi:glycosyl transferase group 1 [Sulfuricella denitrificans skB26]|uniref:Glycosyl transferase group 1 n=2 Tax=Sulfuricella denitrificans TaxID=649841 RepID=S6AKQ7_SULDS|nr:glycosyl transferase group 1 [Sulfuricella denitrificans skB26]
MIWHGLIWRPNIVFTIEPPLFCAPAAWMAARLAGAKAWLHVQDFEVDAAFELGILRSRKLRSAVLAVEKWLLRRFDRVSSISIRMVERLAGKGVDSSRRVLFQNWVDTSAIYPLDNVEGFRRELGIPEDVQILLYSGNMGEKQGLEILIEAAKMLSERRDMLFILCGEGASRQRLMEMSEGLGNVKFFPLQPMDRLNELLNLADIHLLPQRGDAEDLVMPSKLTAILASGRPVIATVREGTQIANVVKDCGIVVNPGDVSGLRDAIVTLAGDSGRRSSLGKDGREYAVRNWKKDNVLRQAFPVK